MCGDTVGMDCLGGGVVENGYMAIYIVHQSPPMIGTDSPLSLALLLFPSSRLDRSVDGIMNAHVGRNSQSWVRRIGVQVYLFIYCSVWFS